MARITTYRSVRTTGGVDAALTSCANAIAGWKHGRVERRSESRLDGRVGSQAALRLKGSLIAGSGDLPMAVRIEGHPDADGAELQITVSDALGFGPMTGMKGKYERAVADLADALVRSIPNPAPATRGPAAGGSVADELTKLADLRQRGLLTDDEFAAEKAKLLR